MSNNEFIIREIQQKDNAALAKIVRTVILEMGAPTIGTAYEDKGTDQLFETYQKEKAIYFVLEHNQKVVGGVGISQLDNFEGNVCELQKMYFLPEARGRGLGSKMIIVCLEKAKEFGFESCYLETLPYMKDAVKLYKKNGFQNLDKPMGNTCHYSCDVWMIKNL
jgi:putative acetyltransferase